MSVLGLLLTMEKDRGDKFIFIKKRWLAIDFTGFWKLNVNRLVYLPCLGNRDVLSLAKRLGFVKSWDFAWPDKHRSALCSQPNEPFLVCLFSTWDHVRKRNANKTWRRQDRRECLGGAHIDRRINADIPWSDEIPAENRVSAAKIYFALLYSQKILLDAYLL